mgnify:CR=1 FL=1
MELTVAEKIRIILGRKGMTASDLARKLGTTPQNIHNKLKRSNFNEKEIKEIASALEVEYEINFLLGDGDKI